MPGCVTFTTDFGWRDPYVAVMKGQVLRRAPALALVDVTHDVEPFRPEMAGFWLARIWPYFPASTVHVAVVDPGVGTGRALVAVEVHAQRFLAPDNGLLAEVAEMPGAQVRHVSVAALERIGAAASGSTFHGRDLFAPLAAELAVGRLSFGAVGDAAALRPGAALPAPVADADAIRGVVAAVDRFGNLISNIDRARLPAAGLWQAEVAGRRLETVASYGAGRPGAPVALVNAWGLVEIAVVQGSAADTLGAGRGEAVTVRRAPAG